MENFWPEDLLGIKGAEEDSSLIALALEAQANGIKDRTAGLVGGFVRERSTVDPAKAWSLELFAAHRPDSATPIFIVRSMSGNFPVAIERFDTFAERIKKVSTLNDLRTALQEIQSAPEIRRIVAILAEDALKAGIPKSFTTSQPPPAIERTLLVGRPSKVGSRDFCHVVLLDVAGFIDVDNLKRLLIAPDDADSNVQNFNGRFVVNAKFQDTVKFTVSEAELVTLKAQVKEALDINDAI